jgi:hypothetical protein
LIGNDFSENRENWLWIPKYRLKRDHGEIATAGRSPLQAIRNRSISASINSVLAHRLSRYQAGAGMLWRSLPGSYRSATGLGK